MPERPKADAACVELATIAREYLANGFCTHLYTEAGFLAEEAPRLRFAVLPDGRDVFDLASLTKAVVTAPLVHAEIAAGRVDMGTRLGEWLGAKVSDLSPALQGLTVGSLLCHTSGLPAWRNLWTCHLGVEIRRLSTGERHARIAEVLGRTALAENPTPVYSDLGFMLLGLALERRWERPLDELFYTLRGGQSPSLLFGPLGDRLRAIPTAYCQVRERLLVGEVHDENCAALGGIAGHAGLFGRGEDLAGFLRAYSRQRGGQLLLEAQFAAAAANRALPGWQLGQGESSSVFGNGQAIGHLGFTGTAFWLRADGGYGILLTNRVISGRRSSLITPLRRRCFAVLDQALSEP